MKSLNHFRSWHAAKEHPAKSLVKDQFQCSCNLPQHDLPFPRSKLCRPRRLDMYWIDLYGVFCSSLELAGCFLNNWKARLLPTNHASDNSGLDAETRTVGYWHFSFSSNLFYTGMCIETQDAISCWTNIRRLSRQHSCEAAHQHRFFSTALQHCLEYHFGAVLPPSCGSRTTKSFLTQLLFSQQWFGWVFQLYSMETEPVGWHGNWIYCVTCSRNIICS